MPMQSIEKVMLDMDGVLSDLERQLVDNGIDSDLPMSQLWQKIMETPRFWTGMKMMPGARRLIDYVEALQVPIEILTSPSKSDPRCRPGKIVWCRSHGIDFPIHFARAKSKYKFAKPGIVLIDDKPETIAAWKQAGGIGIVHRNLAETIHALAEYAPLLPYVNVSDKGYI